jgi:hypothetical protein
LLSKIIVVEANERKKIVASKYCLYVISAINPNGINAAQTITQGKVIDDLLLSPK